MSKRIVIMGATSGIGRAVAERLALKGCRIGVAGRNVKALQLLAEQYPDRVVWHGIDVTSPEASESLRELIEKLGGMDVYFHVAGTGYANDELVSEADVATVETNVTGYTRMIAAAYRYFRDERSGQGHIAAVTSVAGTKGIGNMASYSASKAYQQRYLTALEQLSHIQGLDIRFSDIRPGFIHTALLDSTNRYPMAMTVDYAAPRIVQALSRKRRISVIDWRWSILTAMWRLIPDCLWVRLPVSIGSLKTYSSPRREL